MMGDVDEMIAWFRAQLDEDERVARATIHAGHTGKWGFLEYDEDDQHRWELTFDEIAPDLDDRSMIGKSTMRHIARYDPTRALAEVEAKWRILALYEELCERVRNPVSADARRAARVGQFELEGVVRLLASVYDGRPGYREEWQPA